PVRSLRRRWQKVARRRHRPRRRRARAPERPARRLLPLFALRPLPLAFGAPGTPAAGLQSAIAARQAGLGDMRLASARRPWVAIFFLVARTAGATTVTIGAGETYTLDADLVLHGADTLDANGTPQSPCTIVGNGHSIVANGLTAHIKVQNCVFTG